MAISSHPRSCDAIRSVEMLYVEYADGEKQYHDLKTDPNELHNTYASLSGTEKASLHATLTAVQNYHDARSCSLAEPSRSAMLN